MFPFKMVDFLINGMVIFHSYVSLPEGKTSNKTLGPQGALKGGECYRIDSMVIFQFVVVNVYQRVYLHEKSPFKSIKSPRKIP